MRAKPSVSFAARVDPATDERRRRLQERTGLTTPALIEKAMKLFEFSSRCSPYQIDHNLLAADHNQDKVNTMRYEDEETTNNTAVAMISEDDGFAAAAAEADRHLIQGQIMKFVDGAWTINKASVEKGARFVPVKLAMAWVRWEIQRPVQYVWPKPNGYLPARETLGDLDESGWPPGLDGKPKDPWQNTRFIYLTDVKTAETHTFTNSTAGIRHAYSALAQAVATMRRAQKGALPVVELDSMPMKTKIGPKLRPHFKIVDWKPGAGHAEQAVQPIEPPKRRDEYDDARFDDVPFDQIRY